MFSTILIVCTGNICRSPIGERYLQQLLPSKTFRLRVHKLWLIMKLTNQLLKSQGKMGFHWQVI